MKKRQTKLVKRNLKRLRELMRQFPKATVNDIVERMNAEGHVMKGNVPMSATGVQYLRGMIQRKPHHKNRLPRTSDENPIPESQRVFQLPLGASVSFTPVNPMQQSDDDVLRELILDANIADSKKVQLLKTLARK